MIFILKNIVSFRKICVYVILNINTTYIIRIQRSLTQFQLLFVVHSDDEHFPSD